MRYWIVSELFYPEEVSTGYVMTRIAQKVNETEAVGVICGPSGYQSGVLEATYQLSDSILVKRVKIPRLNKNNTLFRIIGFVLLTVSIAYMILIHVKRSDKLVLVTNPPTLLPVTAFLKKLKGFRFITIVHDVFPENALARSMIREKTFLYKFILELFNWSYRASNHLIAVGNDMAEILKKKVKVDVPIAVITNWADHVDVFPNDSTRFWNNYSLRNKNQIVVQFAGNIGRLQGLDLLIHHLFQVKSDQWYLVLIGDGAQKNLIESFVHNKGMKNIQFLTSRPRDEQNEFLNACDIGLVTLIPGMRGLGVPSKVYNLMSAGKPVLFIGDRSSEICRYIEEYNVGWTFSWEDSEGIIRFFETIESKVAEFSLKGSNARKLVLSKFTKDIILEKYRAELLKF